MARYLKNKKPIHNKFYSVFTLKKSKIMKKKTFKLFVLGAMLFALPTFIAVNVYATKHTVTVTNNLFSPNAINVLVGDTIHWVWSAGTHNTTSNPTPGAIPAGAAAWVHDITTSSTFFDYKVTVAGPYAYYCSIHASPTSTSGMIGGFQASIPTGIQQTALFNANLSIFPKPTSEILNVNFSSTSVGKSQVKIYDIQGKEVQAEESDLTIGGNSIQFSIANLNNGIYFIEVYADKRKLGTQKIIKE